MSLAILTALYISLKESACMAI